MLVCMTRQTPDDVVVVTPDADTHRLVPNGFARLLLDGIYRVHTEGRTLTLVAPQQCSCDDDKEGVDVAAPTPS